MTVAEFNACVEEYADRVYRFIVKNTGHREDAEDIVQSSFEKLWLKHREVAYGKARSYLFTTAYHTMIDHIRKQNKTDSVGQFSEDTLTQDADYTGAGDAIEEALQQLPEIQRTVLLLRDYEGYTYDEIGRITGLSESQVKVYIFRARKAMKKLLVSIDRLI